MHGISRRRAARSLVMVAAGLAAVACGDARVKTLSAGIGRDSVLKLLAAGSTSGDSLANVYRQEQFLVNSRLLDVVFYNPDGITQKQDSSLKDAQVTPIVMVEGKVTGWGWTYYDSLARANHFMLHENK
jgi:hypothetical protein